jgi:hypothetical protein
VFPYCTIIGHLQIKYNTHIEGVCSTLLISSDGKIIGHLKPKYNNPIDNDWGTVVVSLYSKIIGHL